MKYKFGTVENWVLKSNLWIIKGSGDRVFTAFEY